MVGVTLMCAVAICYALCAARLERLSIGGPILFMLAGVLLGPAGVDVVDVRLGGATVQVVTEFTLAVLLFTDASTLGLAMLRRAGSIPVRLLTLGLPLAILTGALLGRWLLPGVSWGLAFLVASVLAPTDAALSLGVMSNPRVPERIRTSLNVESGLNDGIAAPFVTVFVAVVAAESSPGEHWVVESLREIVLALLVAVVVGGAGALLGGMTRRTGWSSAESRSFLVLALAIVSYAGAGVVGGNGFVAAFSAGMVFALVSRDQLRDAAELSETVGVLLSYVVWGLFGALLVGPLVTRHWQLDALLFAALVLTVGRMVPVAIALLGTKLPPRQVLLVGWFGPRGLASVVFLMHSLHGLHLDADALRQPAVEAAVWTIAVSVLAHGLTSGPLVPMLANRSARTATGTSRPPVADPG